MWLSPNSGTLVSERCPRDARLWALRGRDVLGRSYARKSEARVRARLRPQNRAGRSPPGSPAPVGAAVAVWLVFCLRAPPARQGVSVPPNARGPPSSVLSAALSERLFLELQAWPGSSGGRSRAPRTPPSVRPRSAGLSTETTGARLSALRPQQAVQKVYWSGDKVLGTSIQF